MILGFRQPFFHSQHCCVISIRQGSAYSDWFYPKFLTISEQMDRHLHLKGISDLQRRGRWVIEWCQHYLSDSPSRSSESLQWVRFTPSAEACTQHKVMRVEQTGQRIQIFGFRYFRYWWIQILARKAPTQKTTGDVFSSSYFSKKITNCIQVLWNKKEFYS